MIDIRALWAPCVGWGGWPKVDPLGIVSKNNEVVAVTILGAPHRWREGKLFCLYSAYIWGLQSVLWSVAILAQALKRHSTGFPLLIIFCVQSQWGIQSALETNAATCRPTQRQ